MCKITLIWVNNALQVHVV